MKLIVNADDFGLCDGVNMGVHEAYNKGTLTSATLMASHPSAVQAVELAGQMPDLGVGVHLNLLEGKPVSQDKKVHVLLDDKGKFAFKAGKLCFLSLYDVRIKRAIKIELAAQIQWVIDHGIKPTHLDSHKHIHIFPTVFATVYQLAEKFGIGAIRYPFEPSIVTRPPWPNIDFNDKMRSFIVRTFAGAVKPAGRGYFKSNAMVGIAHVGRINTEFWQILTKSNLEGVIEVMTHPGYLDGLDPARTRLLQHRKYELDALCGDQTKKMLSDANIELTHYGKL